MSNNQLRIESQDVVDRFFTDKHKLVVGQIAPRIFIVLQDFYLTYSDTIQVDGDFKAAKKNFIIPAGFIYDGSSIPRIFWSILGAAPGRFLEASCVHDYLYRTGCVPKETADIIFRNYLELTQCSENRATIMYYAVMLFGHSSYNKENTLNIKPHSVELI